MKVKYTTLAGWASFWLFIILASDVVASYSDERRVRLGGFQPRLDHSTHMLYCWLIAFFILMAWWMAVESSQYFLLISMAVVVGKGGQDFNHVLLGWQRSIWPWVFFFVLFGIVPAVLRQKASKKFILPRAWAGAGFGHIPASTS